MDSTMLLAAFGIGLAGAGHCLGMCGGIAAALNLGGDRGIATTLAYHGGRVLSYGALGALLGLIAGSIDVATWTIFLRYAAAVLMILMGLSIANWWRGINALERAGAHLWRPVQRWSAQLLPVRSWRQSLVLGLCWGLMPCGLIYSALAFAATAQSALLSATLMLFFGLGTLPAMLATSLGAAGLQSLLRSARLKLLIALFLIAAGSWSFYQTYQHSGHLLRPLPTAAEPAIGNDAESDGMHQHH